MNINVPDIALTLQDLGIPAERQGDYLKAAIARVVAFRLPLPAEPVVNAADHYKGALEGRVVQAIDVINERLPLDYDGVLELTQQLWTVRYGLVHPSTISQGWDLFDKVATDVLNCDIDMTDPALQRLGRVLTDGIDK